MDCCTESPPVPATGRQLVEPDTDMTTDPLIRAWYVLHTRSRFESVVNEALMKKTKEVFLPKILVRSTRRDRKAMIRVPLFPGYLFVKTDLEPPRASGYTENRGCRASDRKHDRTCFRAGRNDRVLQNHGFGGSAHDEGQ